MVLRAEIWGHFFTLNRVFPVRRLRLGAGGVLLAGDGEREAVRTMRKTNGMRQAR